MADLIFFGCASCCCSYASFGIIYIWSILSVSWARAKVMIYLKSPTWCLQ
jgi:hypothetical protein